LEAGRAPHGRGRLSNLITHRLSGRAGRAKSRRRSFARSLPAGLVAALKLQHDRQRSVVETRRGKLRTLCAKLDARLPVGTGPQLQFADPLGRASGIPVLKALSVARRPSAAGRKRRVPCEVVLVAEHSDFVGVGGLGAPEIFEARFSAFGPGPLELASAVERAGRDGELGRKTVADRRGAVRTRRKDACADVGLAVFARGAEDACRAGTDSVAADIIGGAGVRIVAGTGVGDMRAEAGGIALIVRANVGVAGACGSRRAEHAGRCAALAAITLLCRRLDAIAAAGKRAVGVTAVAARRIAVVALLEILDVAIAASACEMTSQDCIEDELAIVVAPGKAGGEDTAVRLKRERIDLVLIGSRFSREMEGGIQHAVRREP